MRQKFKSKCNINSKIHLKRTIEIDPKVNTHYKQYSSEWPAKTCQEQILPFHTRSVVKWITQSTIDFTPFLSRYNKLRRLHDNLGGSIPQSGRGEHGGDGGSRGSVVSEVGQSPSVVEESFAAEQDLKLPGKVLL